MTIPAHVPDSLAIEFNQLTGADYLADPVAAWDSLRARGPVSYSNQLGGYLSNRRYISIFPKLGNAQWAVVDRNDPDYGIAGASIPALRRLQASPDWRVVYASHGVTVLRKRT